MMDAPHPRRENPTVSVDLVFAPEPDPELTPEPSLIDWAHRPADDELTRIIDDVVNDERDN